MAQNILKNQDIPPILREFLMFSQTIQGKSQKTVHEYYLDLKLYLKFMKKYKNNLEIDVNLVDITDLDKEFIAKITLIDTYEFLSYLANDRKKHHKSEHSEIGITARSRARKISSIRSFFKYLVDKVHILRENPVVNLDFPTRAKTLPKYLSIDDSFNLLEKIEGTYKERDYLIILLFLSCGLRVSELVSINIDDIKDNKLTVLGKGNRERIVYLSDICVSALNDYLQVRQKPKEADKKALFISRQQNRINVQTVKWIVKKYASLSGLSTDISAHKLRHTAATLMYQNGVDIRTLQELLGHKNLDTTMIYTHIDNTHLEHASNVNPISKTRKPKG